MRSQLPMLTGLSAGLITQLSADLLDSGLINETRSTGGGLGRPGLKLEVCRKTAIVVGASIDGNGQLMASFADLTGGRLHEARISFSQPKNVADLAQGIGAGLDRIIKESPFSSRLIARIGIALPALIDSAAGNVHFNATLPSGRTAFAAPVAAITGIPVTVENEMASIARAEHWFGSASGFEDFSLIRIGNAIDSVDVENGVPRSGANGLSASFGHLKILTGSTAPACYCGSNGCITAISSSYGLLEQAGRLADLPFPPVEHMAQRLDDFLDDAAAGHGETQAALANAGHVLGIAIANYLAIANPARLLIAIDNPRMLAALEPAARQSLADYAMPGILPVTDISFMTLGDDWRWRGTAALALERLYLDDHRNAPKRRGRLLPPQPSEID